MQFSLSDSNWQQLDCPELFLDKVKPVDGFFQLSANDNIKFLIPPMYKDVKLICINNTVWKNNLKLFYLEHKDKLYRLNGTSPPIHEVNRNAKVNIDSDNVKYYLSFFGFFVRGEDGPFYIINDLDDTLLPDNLKMDGSFRRIYREPKYFGTDESGNFQMSALTFYSNAIFHTDYLIHPDGTVEMVCDEPLLADLRVS